VASVRPAEALGVLTALLRRLPKGREHTDRSGPAVDWWPRASRPPPASRADGGERRGECDHERRTRTGSQATCSATLLAGRRRIRDVRKRPPIRRYPERSTRRSDPSGGRARLQAESRRISCMPNNEAVAVQLPSSPVAPSRSRCKGPRSSILPEEWRFDPLAERISAKAGATMFIHTVPPIDRPYLYLGPTNQQYGVIRL